MRIVLSDPPAPPQTSLPGKTTGDYEPVDRRAIADYPALLPLHHHWEERRDVSAALYIYLVHICECLVCYRLFFQ